MKLDLGAGERLSYDVVALAVVRACTRKDSQCREQRRRRACKAARSSALSERLSCSVPMPALLQRKSSYGLHLCILSNESATQRTRLSVTN